MRSIPCLVSYTEKCCEPSCQLIVSLRARQWLDTRVACDLHGGLGSPPLSSRCCSSGGRSQFGIETPALMCVALRRLCGGIFLQWLGGGQVHLRDSGRHDRRHGSACQTMPFGLLWLHESAQDRKERAQTPGRLACAFANFVHSTSARRMGSRSQRRQGSRYLPFAATTPLASADECWRAKMSKCR